MTHRDVFIVSTARTAIGTFGGALKDVPNTQLATTAVKAAITRSGLPPDAVGHVVMGNVIPTDTKDAYLARVAAIDAGCPIETPAFNVNRLCGSGLQAIISAAQAIGYGDCDVAVGGGSESMSRGPYFDQAARWGVRMGDAKSTTPGRRCTWASPPRTWPSATRSLAQCKTSSPCKASSAPPPPLLQASSKSKSFRSKSPRAKAPCFSTPTSMCAPAPPLRCWPA